MWKIGATLSGAFFLSIAGKTKSVYYHVFMDLNRYWGCLVLNKVYRCGVVLLVGSFLLAGCIGGGGDSKKRYSVSGVVQDGLGAPLAGV